MEVAVDHYALDPDVPMRWERAKAWYAIRYESIVDAVEEVLVTHAPVAVRSVTIRSLVSGRIHILIQSARLGTGSHMYIRDAGADFASICGGSREALTDLRLVLNRKLLQELPSDLSTAIAPDIEWMVTEMICGYALAADSIERASPGAPPVDPDQDYQLDPGWYAALVAQAPYALAIFHAIQGDFVTGNERLVEMFGYSLAEFDRLPNDQVYTSETPEDDFDKGVELMAGRIRSFSRETAWRHKDGHTVWCEMSNWLVRNDAGQPELLVCAFSLLRDAPEGESYWQRADKRFRHLAQASADPMFIAGEDAIVRYASPACERVLGIDPDEFAGQALIDLVFEDDIVDFQRLDAALANRPRHTERCEVRLIRRDGQWRWFEVTATNLLDVPEINGFAYQVRDVSDRKLVEQLLAQQALFDPLTNLLNRRGMLQRLERALDAAKMNGTAVSVLYIDLDDFKHVNDRFGHESGDSALVVAASRLVQAVGTAGIIARWGGDEFVVAIEDSSPALELDVIGWIRSALSEPIELEGARVTLKGSIGSALTTPGDAVLGPMALLRIADGALYRAKAERHATAGVGQPAWEHHGFKLGHDAPLA